MTLSKSIDIADIARSPQYRGELSGIVGNVAYGWAMDATQPDARTIVEILIDGNSVGVCVANQVQTTGDGTGDTMHGFSFLLSESMLRNGKSLIARVANHFYVLEAPLLICQTGPDVLAVGTSQLSYSGGLVLSGWLWDPQNPGKQLKLTAREDKRLIATTKADRPHPALIQMTSAEHGYLLELPWSLGDGEPHEIHVSDENGNSLAGSPVIVCFEPHGVSGILPKLWPATSKRTHVNAHALELLVRLARAHERFAPPSIGLSQYANWYALHAEQLANTPLIPNVLSVVALVHDGEQQAVAKSIASINRQRHRLTTSNVLSGDLRAGILSAIDDGAGVIIPLSAGDHLAPTYADHALDALSSNDANWVIFDCDQDTPTGTRSNPWLKPSWDPDLFLGLDISTPGSAWKADFLHAALKKFPGVALPDWQCVSVLLAYYIHRSGASETHVVRKVGVEYHRSANAPTQPYEIERSHNCVQLLKEYISEREPQARISHSPKYPKIIRVVWPLPENPPLVSLLVPTRDHLDLLQVCIEGLLEMTDYPNKEIIIVDNQSTDPATLAYLKAIELRGVRVLSYPHPFNYSAINNFAVNHAQGEIIGLINNDIEIVENGWLREMVSQLMQPEIGIVGAKLLWKNGMVQHGGVVVGVEGLAAHTGNNWTADDAGWLGFNATVRRQSAVTAACLLIRRSDYLNVSGLDADMFPVAFNDVDLCLKMTKSGKKIIWSPFAVLIHAESASRGKDARPEQRARAMRESQHFILRWNASSKTDQYYHPFLAASSTDQIYAALTSPM